MFFNGHHVLKPYSSKTWNINSWLNGTNLSFFHWNLRDRRNSYSWLVNMNSHTMTSSVTEIKTTLSHSISCKSIKNHTFSPFRENSTNTSKKTFKSECIHLNHFRIIFLNVTTS